MRLGAYTRKYTYSVNKVSTNGKIRVKTLIFEVCKTCIHRFDPGPRLHFLSPSVIVLIHDNFSATERHGAHGVTKNSLRFIHYLLFKVRLVAETRFRVFRGSISSFRSQCFGSIFSVEPVSRRSEVLATSATAPEDRHLPPGHCR